MEKLSELGVLFLLFEMGLELSIDRLRVGSLAAAWGQLGASWGSLHDASRALLWSKQW